MTVQDQQRINSAYRRLAGRWRWNAASFAGFQGTESSIRRRAVQHLALSPGDTVLDLACGRGSNFPHLMEAVGAGGRIVGVDFSPDMLAAARERVRKRGWSNVDLVEADAATIEYGEEFDGAICTNSLSIIPEWREALRRLAAAVRPGKRIVVVDGQATGAFAGLANVYARLFARVVAADLSRDIAGECRSLLKEPRLETRLFGAYFIVSGEPVAGGSDGLAGT